MCETNVKCMCQSKTMYMDGTFEYSKKGFYTVHTFLHNHYILVMFCFPKQKTTQTYQELLRLLDDIFPNIYKVQ